jgi:uncharacterized membrane protein YdjX (TVP38/TMEM64 family)
MSSQRVWSSPDRCLGTSARRPPPQRFPRGVSARTIRRLRCLVRGNVWRYEDQAARRTGWPAHIRAGLRSKRPRYGAARGVSAAELDLGCPDQRHRCAGIRHPRLLRLGDEGVLALAATASGLFLAGAIFLPHSPTGIRAAVASYGWAAPLLFVAAWTALTPALFSGTILAGAAGLMFGAGLGTAVGVLGATVGGLISFAIARRLGADAFNQLAPPKLRRVEDRLSARPLRSLLILRLMPGMPATWLNYAVGLTRVRAGTFAVANALGRSAPDLHLRRARRVGRPRLAAPHHPQHRPVRGTEHCWRARRARRASRAPRRGRRVTRDSK